MYLGSIQTPVVINYKVEHVYISTRFLRIEMTTYIARANESKGQCLYIRIFLKVHQFARIRAD